MTRASGVRIPFVFNYKGTVLKLYNEVVEATHANAIARTFSFVGATLMNILLFGITISITQPIYFYLGEHPAKPSAADRELLMLHLRTISVQNIKPVGLNLGRDTFYFPERL